MLTINDGGSLLRALSMPLDDRLKGLLNRRSEELDGSIEDRARFIIVQPRDRPCWVEEGLGFSVFQNPADGSRFGEPDFTPGWEWMENHGSFYELVFILDDSGFAHVVIIEKAERTHPAFLRLCTTYASEEA